MHAATFAAKHIVPKSQSLSQKVARMQCKAASIVRQASVTMIARLYTNNAPSVRTIQYS